MKNLPKNEIKNELSKILESLLTMMDQFHTKISITVEDNIRNAIYWDIKDSCANLQRVLTDLEKL